MGDHVLGLFTPVDDHAYELRTLMVERCTRDEWPAAARRCIVETSSITAPKRCREHLSFDQIKQLDAAIVVAEQAERRRTIPAACDEYERLLAALAACRDAPAGLHESLAAQFAKAKEGWPTLPDKSVLDGQCKSALTSLKPVLPLKCVP